MIPIQNEHNQETKKEEPLSLTTSNLRFQNEVMNLKPLLSYPLGDASVTPFLLHDIPLLLIAKIALCHSERSEESLG